MKKHFVRTNHAWLYRAMLKPPNERCQWYVPATIFEFLKKAAEEITMDTVLESRTSPTSPQPFFS